MLPSAIDGPAGADQCGEAARPYRPPEDAKERRSLRRNRLGESAATRFERRESIWPLAADLCSAAALVAV